MKLRKEWKQCGEWNSGFTLVEMIITIAVSTILVGSIVAAFGYINSGKAKRSAARFDSNLNTAQTETMMLKDPTYLYLYKLPSGAVKCALLKSDCKDRAELDNALNGVVPAPTPPTPSPYETPKGGYTRRVLDVGGSNVEVTAKYDDGSPDYVLDDSNMLRIVFDKASGRYKDANAGGTDTKFVNEIVFSGNERYSVTLVKMTGKHVLSQSASAPSSTPTP